MTYIEISGSDDSLEEVKLLSEEIFRDDGIQAKTKIYNFRQDSVDVSQLLTTLQVTFTGVIAVVQVINLVINIQEKRKGVSTNSSNLIHVKVRASNNKELDLKISGELTEDEIKSYQKVVNAFVSDFLSTDDRIELKALGSLEIAKINSLFKELESKLSDVRVQICHPPKKVGDATIFSSSFEHITLTKAIQIGVEETFYLKIEDVNLCKEIFYILERENILSFHKESTNIRILEVENEFVGFVGYRVEVLSLFSRVICDRSSNLNDEFHAYNQHKSKIIEKEREIEIHQQHNAELLELAKMMASQPISIETHTHAEIQFMSGDRHINTGGGNYVESNSGVYVESNYIDMDQDLNQAATQIQRLIKQLQNEGMTIDVAQEQVAKDMATQAQKNSGVKDKLVKWGQTLGSATVSDVVKGAVKLAIRSAGIPLP